MANLALLNHAENLATEIIAKCFGNNGAMSNPIDLIRSGMELVQTVSAIDMTDRKACLISALQIVASGKDGICGTDDDLIEPETLKMLNILLQHNIVDHVVEALLDAAKGRLNIIAIKDVLIDTAAVSVGCIDWCMWKSASKKRAQ
jgi:hypothetical protein